MHTIRNGLSRVLLFAAVILSTRCGHDIRKLTQGFDNPDDGEHKNPEDCDGPMDCEGVCNGNAEMDGFGNCCPPENRDCFGECNGGGERDNDGDCCLSHEKDCAGDCYGNHQNDRHGNCCKTEDMDCDGICNGDSTSDRYGNCCTEQNLDCDGECNGPHQTDGYGNCCRNEELDCSGRCNGGRVADDSGGCCHSNEVDCNGQCHGEYETDDEGTCCHRDDRDCQGRCFGPYERDDQDSCCHANDKDCLGRCDGNAIRDNDDECCYPEDIDHNGLCRFFDGTCGGTDCPGTPAGVTGCCTESGAGSPSDPLVLTGSASDRCGIDPGSMPGLGHLDGYCFEQERFGTDTAICPDINIDGEVWTGCCTEEGFCANRDPSGALGCSYTNLTIDRGKHCGPPTENCRYESYNPDSDSTRHYFFCSENLSWNDADSKCQNFGYYLVQIDDQTENNFIRDNLTGESWIGAFERDDGERIWTWRGDGGDFWDSTNECHTGRYCQWEELNPDESAVDKCATMHDDDNGNWDDLPCENSFHYVCEVD